ncbi:GtrA family protein [Uliginosibacterium sp. H1]|uniref:GtrA family protein n=1 Tax=Uliginosibacterium sp. H1 TaxID=3114757 RepID=UPI003FCC9E66
MSSASLWQFLRYVLVGFLNTAVGYSVIFGLMYGAGWSPESSNLAGYLVGMVVSFTVNRRFTFRSNGAWRSQFVRFLVVFVVAYLSNLLILVALVRVLGVHEAVSQIVSGGVYVVSAFLMNKCFVFSSNYEQGR